MLFTCHKNQHVDYDEDDEQTTSTQDTTYLLSVTYVYEDDMTYPGTAMFALEADSDDTDGQLPDRAYRIHARLCRVPSNYNAESRIYTSDWDGTLDSPQYTTNPVWCLLNLLTNTRYGAGRIVSDDDIDLPSFYRAARICDELVPDGRGGYEPRFTIGAVLEQRQNAYAAVQQLASVFRGFVVWIGGKINVVVDAGQTRDDDYNAGLACADISNPKQDPVELPNGDKSVPRARTWNAGVWL